MVTLDIETCPYFYSLEEYQNASGKEHELFTNLLEKKKDDKEKESVFGSKELIDALYSRVIGIGILITKIDKLEFKYFCISDFKSEADMLQSFVAQDFMRSPLMDKTKNLPQLVCGHNIVGFDLPFITRRCIFNNIVIPQDSIIKVTNKKPWDLTHIFDTMQFWALTNPGQKISLDNLCKFLDVETPKQDFCGADVAKACHDKQFKRIQEYCELDVRATYNCMKKLIRYN